MDTVVNILDSMQVHNFVALAVTGIKNLRFVNGSPENFDKSERYFISW